MKKPTDQMDLADALLSLEEKLLEVANKFANLDETIKRMATILLKICEKQLVNENVALAAAMKAGISMEEISEVRKTAEDRFDDMQTRISLDVLFDKE